MAKAECSSPEEANCELGSLLANCFFVFSLVFRIFPEGSSGLAQLTGLTDQLKFKSPQSFQDFKMSFDSTAD